MNNHSKQTGQFRAVVPPWRSPPSNAAGESTPDLLDFFISYTAEDLSRTQWIAHTLEVAGYRVSYQHRDFETGGRFQRDIDQRLERARNVVAVISAASLASDWCRREWEAAGDRLLPIRVEPVDVVGLLGIRAYTDLFGPRMDVEENQREALLRAVAGRQTAESDLKASSVTIELPPRGKLFIGRDDLLDRIFSHFYDSKALKNQRLTLAGVGGTGKTALAVEYGHRMREHNYYKDIWYVSAESEGTLTAGLSALIAELQLPKRSISLGTQLSDGLARKADWLLIIDDASNLDSIIDYLPTAGTGHILVTSENPSTWGRANVLPVAGWEPDVAIEFLLRETGSIDRQGAQQLVTELEAHPERLLQAVSYIDRTQTSIMQYLNIYRERVSQQHDRFAATLALALERLTSNPLAMDLLRFGSFLSPERIPTDLLVEGLRSIGYEPDDAAINKAAEPLIQFSLAQRDDVSIKFSRLVQSQVRTSAINRGEATKWIETAVQAVDQLFPSISELDDPAVWRRAGFLLPHALVAVDAARADKLVLPKAGRLLCRAAHFIGGGAMLQGRSAVPHHKAILDAKPPLEGAFDTAVALLEESREILQKSKSDPLDRSEVLAEIGEYHRAEADYFKAIEIFSEAYELVTQTESAPREVVALRLAELARTQRDAGLIDKACSQLEEARDICAQAGPAGRGNLAAILDSLGIARSLQGRYPEAIAALSEALAIQEEVFGINHVEVAITLDSLSDAFARYGDHRAMRDSVDRMLRIDTKAYGEESVARCAGLLSAARYAIESDDGERVYKLGAEISELVGETVIPHDSTRSDGYLLLATADRMLGQRRWREFVEKSVQALSDARLPTSEPKLRLVDFLIEDGELSEAISLASSLKQDSIQRNDWSSATAAALAESDARIEAGDMEHAESSLRTFTEILKRADQFDDWLAATLELERGRILEAAERIEEALAAYTESYRFAGRQGYMLKQAEACIAKGQLLIQSDKLEEGIKALREGLEARSRNLIKGHPAITEAQLVVARTEGMCGNELESRRLLDAVVAATAEAKGARSMEVGQLYIDVSGVLAAMDRRQEAVSRAEEGYRLMTLAAVDKDGEVEAACDVALRMQEIGKPERAHELASIAYRLAHETDEVSLLSRLRASEAMAQVSLFDNDRETAERIAEELRSMLNSDVPPRVRVSTWLIVADIAQDQRARQEALEQACALNLDALNTPRRTIVLQTAEANWQLDENRRAIDLLEPTLSQYSDNNYLLQALAVLVPAAIDDKDERNAREFLSRASALIEKEQDDLRQMYQRIWIADALCRLESEEDAIVTVNSIANALGELDEDTKMQEAVRIAPLYRQLAGLYAEFDKVDSQVDALKQAVQLCRESDQPDELARTLYELARVDSKAGRVDELDGIRETASVLVEQLKQLDKDSSAIEAQANVGMMYLELGDFRSAHDTLAQALAHWDNLKNSNTPSHALLLVPLARACLAFDDVQSAAGYLERAVSCSQLEGATAYPDLQEALFEIAVRQVADAGVFGQIVESIRLLGELWKLPPYVAADLSRAAKIRADAIGWDDLATSLIDEADERLNKIKNAPADVVVRIAAVKAESLEARGLIGDAVSRLNKAVETVRSNDDSDALVHALAGLGDSQSIAGNPAAAAISYREAAELLVSSPDALPNRLRLLVAEARALLAAEKRGEGIRVIRQATKEAESEAAPHDQDMLGSLSGLALSLAADAMDMARAGIVLGRAEELNTSLLDGESPDPDAFPRYVLATNQIHGAAPAMEAIKAALQRHSEAQGALIALFEFVNQADLEAAETIDLIAASHEQQSVTTTAVILARAFASREAFDDARSVLKRGIELLGADGGEPAVGEVQLLLMLSQLDTTENRAEACLCLRRAVAIAEVHHELAGDILYLRKMLGVAYGDGGQWTKAVEVLSQLDEKDETALRYLSIGRAMIGQYERAIDGLNRLATIQPDPQVLYALAIVENWSGQKQAALDSLAEVMESGEMLGEALALCAQVCNDIAEYKRAVEYAAAAQRIDPVNVRAYSSEAWALQHLGLENAAACETTFAKVMSLSPGGSEYTYALKGRAGARRLLGDLDGAVADYEEVLERVKSVPDHWLEAWAKYSLGRYDEADEAYLRALQEEPDRVGARFDRALCAIVAGKPEAVEQYRKILQDLDKKNAQVRLAPLRIAENDLRVAVAIDKSLATNPMYREVVAAVEASVMQTETLVVQPIFPRIPDASEAAGTNEIRFDA